MLEFQEKRKIRNILYSKITLVILIGLLIVVGSATLNIYDKQKESEEFKLKVSEEFNKLEKRELELQASIEKLQTNRGIEEEIRERFGVILPDEEVIVVVEPREEEKDNQNFKKDQSFWSKIFGF